MADKSVIKGFGSLFLHIKDCHSTIWFLLSKSSSHIYDATNLNFINASEKVFLLVFVQLSYVSVKLSIFPDQSGQNRFDLINYIHITLWEGQEITRKCKFVYFGFSKSFEWHSALDVFYYSSESYGSNVIIYIVYPINDHVIQSKQKNP